MLRVGVRAHEHGARFVIQLDDQIMIVADPAELVRTMSSGARRVRQADPPRDPDLDWLAPIGEASPGRRVTR